MAMVTCKDCKGVISNVEGRIVGVVRLCPLHAKAADYREALERIAKTKHRHGSASQEEQCPFYWDTRNPNACDCHVAIAQKAVEGNERQ